MFHPKNPVSKGPRDRGIYCLAARSTAGWTSGANDNSFSPLWNSFMEMSYQLTRIIVSPTESRMEAGAGIEPASR